VVKSRHVHGWDLSCGEARALQERLRREVTRSGRLGKVRNVAGADVSWTKGGRKLFSGVVVMSLPGLEIVEEVWASSDACFQYVPGLLSFREIPGLLKAFEKLRCRPDVVICDGQGIAHPRRMGLASHLGLVLGLPTIGCAKSRLIGTFAEPGEEAGSRSPLKVGKEIVGAVLRTRSRVRPVFVSTGHKIGLERSVSIVTACCKGFRLPEPSRRAHQLAGRACAGVL